MPESTTRTSSAEPEALPPVPWAVWRLALVIVLGSFMSTLASSLINVGVNTLARSFDAPLTYTQWISSAYIVAFAAAVPLSAWTSRRVGAGRLWLIALTGFVTASGLCALAPNLPVLIVIRALQGLAGAFLLPTGQVIIGQAAGPARIGRVLNTTKIVSVLGPAAGPALGGLLIGHLSWRWLFLVNVPVGVVAIVAGLLLVPRGAPTRGQRFDVLGFVLIACGLPLFLYGTINVSRLGLRTNPTSIVVLAAALIALTLFSTRSLRIDYPLLDLRLFTNRLYTAATASVFFTGASLLGALILLPLYWQLLRGYGVIDTGLLLFAVGGGTAISMPLGGTLTDRIGGGLISIAGLIVAFASIAPMMFLPADAALPLVLALQAVTGFGLGMSAMPALSVAFKSVPKDRLPDAASEANIIQRIGGALGTALLVVVLERHDHPKVADFHTAFGYLTTAVLIATALATWLTLEEARHREATT